MYTNRKLSVIGRWKVETITMDRQTATQDQRTNECNRRCVKVIDTSNEFNQWCSFNVWVRKSDWPWVESSDFLVFIRRSRLSLDVFAVAGRLMSVD